MSALAYTVSTAPLHTAETNILDGAGVELFTTSCGPVTGDMTSGAGLDLFTTSCGPTQGDAISGGGVEMFTTSC